MKYNLGVVIVFYVPVVIDLLTNDIHNPLRVPFNGYIRLLGACISIIVFCIVSRKVFNRFPE